MSENSLTFEEFRSTLPLICNRETIKDSEKWNPENPLYAHCAVVSLLAQDLYGGDLLRASLLPYPEFAEMNSHYWNKLPDGKQMDFTTPQFHGRRPPLIGESRTRRHMLFDPNTGEPREIMKRYKLLALRLARVHSGGNPLFDNLFYQLCFWNALDSPCQKMKFGCVIVRNKLIIYQGANKTIPELCPFCEERCVRLSAMKPLWISSTRIFCLFLRFPTLITIRKHLRSG
ncbi:MAG: hypothetical protein A2942_04795 [Candidatus Lloydbacteria bacterium RIFCSPLOWO2_01_FULL_50_20]|uniref:Uncharacterized protein n=1 Tax=Candidatus Lloydbacteria bacterium RIFCSPLOWO2_01_FULL_50_20 TaxID=1798665 RepID=A0A1G2DGR3_9BACT|nr:MAG: hypothetical protein A3C13_01065 [Candidatus Lloydbacteria bacterium RIFCSPHIGHO2_02_FULL_50_11]OGZ12766.1 MAG: hypothetical protein A2942_04795 [Candidatus Lloydbacteria bacterium RIFCSPLOWO2_01_FULL_50_20]